MICNVHDIGLVPYEQAWQWQERLANEIAAGERPATLLMLEHPHTYTFGRSGQAENLLWEKALLDTQKIRVHWVDRGGDVTYHGPGQLVGYPLFPLASPEELFKSAEGTSRIPQADYVGYVRKLEQALIKSLARLGLAAGQIPGLTGVWVQPDLASRCLRCRPEDRKKPAKIAAIGVKVDARGISRHGFAINVNPDMSYWEGIIACGIKDHPVVSLEDIMSKVPPMQAVKDAVLTSMQEVFGYKMAYKELTFG